MQLPEFLIDHPDGEIRLTGHRISLYNLITSYQDGSTPEMILKRFPSLPLELIRATIAFYLKNQDEVDAYVTDYRAELDRQRSASSQSGPSLAELRDRLKAMKREKVL